MNRAIRYAVQGTAFIAFALLIGYFSASPAYQYGSAETGVIKLSLSHATKRIVPCVMRTPEELAELAANMRRAEKCERARLPLLVELEIDGRLLASVRAEPSGLWNDGPASVYRRFEIQPGRYVLEARLRDTARAEGWDYTHSETVVVAPGRYLTVTFRAETGGFEFR